MQYSMDHKPYKDIYALDDTEKRWIAIVKKQKYDEIRSVIPHDAPSVVEIPEGLQPMWERHKYRKARYEQLKREEERLTKCVEGLKNAARHTNNREVHKQLEVYQKALKYVSVDKEVASIAAY